MSIVRLQKVTFYGLARQRDDVLEGLQRLGCLHLIDLPGNGDKEKLEQSDRSYADEAINYLLACPVQNPNQHRAYIKGDPRASDCLAIAHQAIENRDQRNELSDERDCLERSIELTEPWGEFEMPPPEETKGLLFWFYAIPRRQVGVLKETNLVWQVVNQDRQFVYVLVLSADEPDLPFSRISLERRPLSVLKRRLANVNEELEQLHWQRVAMTRWLDLMQADLDSADDELSRREALGRIAGDEDLFALQGWAPKSTIKALQKFANENGLALAVGQPLPDELPPTLLQNPKAVAGAEGAVTFYITPSYKSWDPTWVMYGSFALFFAMIMSDAAYGIIMGFILALFWRKLGTGENGRRFRSLLLALVVATIAYGVAIGSYFGVTPYGLEWLQLKVEGQPLASHQDAMMMLSLAIGVFHLSLANLITAWRYLGSPKALCSLGWAVGLVGGFVLILFYEPTNKAAVWLGESIGSRPEEFQPAVKHWGLIGLIAGLAMVFLFSSSRPLFTLNPKVWALRLFDGLLGLTNVTKAFGDTLSYLRLFALGLASAQLAVTFNNLANGVMEIQGLGFLLAILILVIGHSVNIVLGIMGGVVHGLRLNCIEFFNWSLTDEGYPFRPFCKKAG